MLEKFGTVTNLKRQVVLFSFVVFFFFFFFFFFCFNEDVLVMVIAFLANEPLNGQN